MQIDFRRAGAQNSRGISRRLRYRGVEMTAEARLSIVAQSIGLNACPDGLQRFACSAAISDVAPRR